MHDTILVRYCELALKGDNRRAFEERLASNIRDCLKQNHVSGKTGRRPGRILIRTEQPCPWLSHVFGIVSFSPALSVAFDTAKVKDAISTMLDGRDFGTFRVSARRLDRSVSSSSQEMNIEFGAYIAEKYGKRVSLKEHDIDVGIEVESGVAYVFIEKHAGHGGLPLGIGGTVGAVLDSPASVLAAWLMMKRGLAILPLGDHGLLSKYAYGTEMVPIEMGDRRWQKLQAIVVGDTLSSLKKYDYGKLVLRPLVGFSDEEIEDRLASLERK